MADPAQTLEFSVNDAWKQFQRENSWAAFIPECAQGPDGTKYMRGVGRKTVYKVVKETGNDQEYVCNTCESDIQGTKVAHPIWDGPFPCSGSGRCHYEIVPYCPKCEEKPSFSGTPISVGPKF